MRREHWLIAGGAVVVAVAVSLRVIHHAGSPPSPSTQPDAERRPTLTLTIPHDYVAAPVVAPAEATAGPKRIVSLAPSVTEIVCALGLRDRLVGRTRYCQWPPDVASVRMVGVLSEANYGLIKALDPDLILATTNSGEVPANLAKLGLRCETVGHEGLPEVYAAIDRIGRWCDRPATAAALVAAIRADLDRLRQAVERAQVPPRRAIVLFGELPVPPQSVFVAGPGLFLDDLLQMAGHQNAAREVLKSSQGEIPLERMRVLDPQVILEFRDPDHAGPQVMADLYAAWSQVGDLQAIRGHRVRSIGGPEWLSAGPRMAIELHRFITVLSEAD